MKDKEIIFLPKSKEAEFIVDRPEPAKNFFPDIFKNIPNFVEGRGYGDKKSNISGKKCMPFLDSFTTGYIQKTWCDISVTNNKNEIIVQSSSEPRILDSRKENQLYIPEEYLPFEYTWQMQWIPKVPKGYSILYTHPFNRYDLPFYSLTGIVDSDTFYYEQAANHPVFIKKDFSGIIPYGTPMVLMIPIKRDSWISYFEKYKEENYFFAKKPLKMFNDYYKKFHWVKKEYN